MSLRRKPMRASNLLLIPLSLLFACVTPAFIANNMTDSIKDMKKAFFTESSPQHARAAGPGLLMQLDGFLVSSPENFELLAMGAEMNCGYALTFLDTRDPQWAAALYDKGRRFALRAIRLQRPELARALEAGDEARAATLLQGMDREYQPLIFWTGLCWGGYINATKEVEAVTDLPVVEEIIKRSLEIDPGYYFGAGHLFFGMLNAGRSEMLGGDLAKGKEHLDRAMEITGGKFLFGKLMYARTYAVNKQDAKLFVKLLEEVVGSQEESPSEMRLANNVAKQDAAELLTRVADFFPGWKADVVEEEGAPLEEDDEELDLD